MSLQVDRTLINCIFCLRQKEYNKLVRSMHGLYCSNENCYTRSSSGNLVPPAACEKCGENAFYMEKDGTIDTAVYLCIACGHEEST